MSLVRHAKSPFWYMSFMVNGKTIFRSTKTNNKVLAHADASALRVSIDAHLNELDT